VVATGQVPADLEIPGAAHLTTSDQFLELDELPRRILFIGGGYIAFEFAHVAALAGSQVTVLHRGPRPLSLFDPDLVDQLVQRTRELGIDVHLGTEAIGIEKSSAQLSAGLQYFFHSGKVAGSGVGVGVPAQDGFDAVAQLV